MLDGPPPASPRELDQLAREFHRAMVGIVENTKKLKPPERFPAFERMLADGGLQTARRLLASREVSSGFATLLLHPQSPESLKLSVEYVVLDPRWRPLFTEEELAIATARLKQHGCPLPPGVEGSTLRPGHPPSDQETAPGPEGPVRIESLAQAINSGASRYEIRHLHELRGRLKSTNPTWRTLFDSRTIRPDYAFHVGGRTELQFNIGIEADGNARLVRHGVAFSLETSQTLPTIDPLIPKIERFNEYVATRPEEFSGFCMWDFYNGRRSPDRPVNPIGQDLVRAGAFIMLGARVPEAATNVDRILHDFDRLLPLYRFVEASGPLAFGDPAGAFVARRAAGAPSTVATLPERVIHVSLRHNQLQAALDGLLCEEFGASNVAMEHPLDVGVRVDAAARTPAGMTYYEIKVSPDAMGCLRLAIGQLLEYAYWGHVGRANRLVVVGEAEPDAATRTYLSRLRTQLAIPVWYQRIQLRPDRLFPSV